MMDSSEHVFGGMIIGAIFLYAIHKKGLLIAMNSAMILWFVTLFSTLIPDVLEPADSPNHRSFFHSYFVLLALLYFLATQFTTLVIGDLTLGIVSYFVVLGYVSHLILDLPYLPVVL